MKKVCPIFVLILLFSCVPKIKKKPETKPEHPVKVVAKEKVQPSGTYTT